MAHGFQHRCVEPDRPGPAEDFEPDPFYFHGVSGGSFNASLIVGPPQCPGDVTALDDAYACWSKVMAGKPFAELLRRTLTVSKAPGYVLASYFLPLRLRGQTTVMLHSHSIFTHGGKWSDLHVSVVQPTDDDLDMLERLRTTFRYGKD